MKILPNDPSLPMTIYQNGHLNQNHSEFSLASGQFIFHWFDWLDEPTTQPLWNPPGQRSRITPFAPIIVGVVLVTLMDAEPQSHSSIEDLWHHNHFVGWDSFAWNSFPLIGKNWTGSSGLCIAHWVSVITLQMTHVHTHTQCIYKWQQHDKKPVMMNGSFAVRKCCGGNSTYNRTRDRGTRQHETQPEGYSFNQAKRKAGLISLSLATFS